MKGFEKIKEVAEAHFQALYTKDGQPDEEVTTDFLSHIPTLIHYANNQYLLDLFSEEEIISVIWSMEVSKSPSTDRFTIHFCRACWPIIKLYLT